MLNTPKESVADEFVSYQPSQEIPNSSLVQYIETLIYTLKPCKDSFNQSSEDFQHQTFKPMQLNFNNESTDVDSLRSESESSTSRSSIVLEQVENVQPENFNNQENNCEIEKNVKNTRSTKNKSKIKKATQKTAKKAGRKPAAKKTAEKPKKQEKRVKYTTKGPFDSGQKKNAGGILRDRIMKILKETITYSEEGIQIVNEDVSSLSFLYTFLKSMSLNHAKLLCIFLKQYDINYKDHKKIKNRKNLKAIKDMCSEYKGGNVFAQLIKVYLEQGKSDIKNWVDNYKGKAETLQFVKSDELHSEVGKYLGDIWASFKEC